MPEHRFDDVVALFMRRLASFGNHALANGRVISPQRKLGCPNVALDHSHERLPVGSHIKKVGPPVLDKRRPRPQ